MIYTISNEKLTVQVTSVGGDFWSIEDANGVQHLWQGDERYWSSRSVTIFPYIGRLTDKTYKYKDNFYQLETHGIARRAEFEVLKQAQNEITFILRSNEEIKKMYPFEFDFCVTYTLNDNEIIVNYTVVNNDTKAMYFGVGGHPAFNVVVNDDIDFTDYYLEFGSKKDTIQIDISTTGYLTGNDTEYKLKEGDKIDLEHSLFDTDAIILKGMDNSITLKCEKNDSSITVEYPSMKYLGLWHTPKTQAPFLCIEPWTSLPARQGIIEDIEKQEDLISLNPDSRYENIWKVIINK